MVRSTHKGPASQLLASALAAAMLLAAAMPVEADIGDSPLAAIDGAADIGGVYFFLDPADNTKVVMAMTVRGFIVPAQNETRGFFAPDVQFRFQIENTGNAKGDLFIDVTFSKQTSRTAPQTASIIVSTGQKFTAPTTVSSSTSETAPSPVVTTDSPSSISFFAGLVDDPSFFDVPAGLRHVNSMISGNVETQALNRGRDSFAGYNTTAIVLRAPATMLRGSSGDRIGLTCFTQRRAKTLRFADADQKSKGQLVNVNRMANPGISSILIPFSRRDEYGRASTADDAEGVFENDILTTLVALRADLFSINLISTLAVIKGDILRLDLSVPNTGPGGGNNSQAAYPNGRRPGDDAMDTILTLLNNRVDQGDNVNANDVAFRNAFPFLAAPHQPLASGADDGTRN
ncbi:MAG: DUF4331 family protein [Blastocatellia bacterium]